MIIVLMGYMGSGKSHVGSDLAQKMKMNYFDLDHYIEIQEGKTVSDIFQHYGEIYFRKKESFYLKQVLDTQDNSIISLGGGTPCFSDNIKILKSISTVKSVYLQTSIDELAKRLFPERKKRPLIAHLETLEVLKDFIRKHIFERSYFYSQADYKINTDTKKVDQISKECISLLG